MDLNLSKVFFLIWLLFGERTDVGRHLCVSVFFSFDIVRAHTHTHAYRQAEKQKSQANVFQPSQLNVNII